MDDYVKSLPDDWRHDRLKDVAKINQNALGSSTDVDYELDYLEISNVDGNGIVDRSLIEHLRFEDAPSRARRQVVEGSTIISSVRPNLQAAAYIDEHDDGLICSTGFNVVDPDVEKLIPKYLYYCLISDGAKQYFVSTAKGVGYPAIGDKEFGAVAIPLPPRPEQERIAAFLDEKCAAVDKAIEVKRKQQESVDAIWKNLLCRATTQGVEGIGRDARPHGLAGGGHTGRMPLPSGWRYARLKDCFSYGKGLNITKIDLVEDGTPVISYGQIHAKQNDGTHLKDELLRYVPDDLAQSNSGAKLKIGDIVFADTSEDLDGIGNCVINDVGDGVYAGYHTLIARAKDPRNSKYLSYLFQTDCWREQLRKRACGIKVFSLTQRLLSNVKVVLPPHGEQKLIVKYLDARHNELESLAVNLQRQIDTLEQYRKSLIHEYVTGVRRVV
ncbi:MAG: restriction endonuclease subunit S [Kiritimatiellae bacterium]|nr:restriction endonuclease subunit S [Kiritimatiellia bacterium]MBQ6337867.1 restriction endonuclease subunit S [Kiritimatiellia bacterium]